MCRFLVVPISKKKFVHDRALVRLKRGGPDYFGKLNVGGFTFYHWRLSITDKNNEDANQPILSPCGQFVLVFNGEIFNFKELAKKYGMASTYTSDTLFLMDFLKMRDVSDTQRISELNGFYSFVFYNLEENKIYAARDSIGVKPLFYKVDDGILLSSDFAAVSSKISERYKADFLAHNFINTSSLGDENYGQIMPGELLTYDCNKKCVVRNLFGVIYKSNSKKCSSTTELIDSIADSISRRVDESRALLFSGGIDSSVLAAIGTKVLGLDYSAYNMSKFADKKYDEKATIIASEIGMDLINVPFDESKIKRYVDLIPEVFDLPFADTSALTTIGLIDFVSMKERVVLSGDGGDELFFGYKRLLGREKRNGKRLMRNDISWITKTFGYSLSFRKFYNATNKIYSDAGVSYKRRNFSDLEILGMGGDVYVRQEFNENIINSKLDARYGEILTYLSDDIMYKMDKVCMYFSVENREPLLDKDILTTAFNLSRDQCVKNGVGKYPLIEILKKLGLNIDHFLEKKGFGYDLTNVIPHLDMKKLDSLAAYDFNMSIVNELCARVKKGDKSLYQRFWSLYVLASWYYKNAD